MKGFFTMIYKEYINNDIINYESGLNHFSKKEALYEKYLFKFLDDNHFNEAETALEKNDIEEFFKIIHAFKGICGTLSLTKLFHSSSMITLSIKSNKLDTIPYLFNSLKNDYSETYSHIEFLKNLNAQHK